MIKQNQQIETKQYSYLSDAKNQFTLVCGLYVCV